MAVLSVTELQEGTESQIALSDRTYIRRYHVTTNDSITGKLLAEQAPEIPNIRDPLTFVSGDLNVVDDSRVVQSIRAVPIDDAPSVFEVTVRYGPVPVAVENEEDPTLDEVEFSIDSFESEEPIYLDIDDNPIQNSAGETFDPPLTEVFVDMVITIVKNESDSGLLFRSKLNLKYNNKINKTTFLGIRPHRGLLKIRSVKERRGEVKYWRTTYQILVRGGFGWDRHLIDEGFKFLQFSNVDEGDIQVEAKDADGNVVNSPIRLDGQGKPLLPGSAAVGILFTTRDEVDFAPLFEGVDFS